MTCMQACIFLMRDMGDVTADLGTNADKIRGLLREGYLRADVARYLGIRYQAVRQVAVDAGIEGGLRRSSLPRAISERSDPVDPLSHLPRLIGAGFERLGAWTIEGDSLTLESTTKRGRAVYLMVEDGVILYIGLSTRGVHARMRDYRRGPMGQRTSYRINGVIRDAIASGRSIEVYFLIPDPIKYLGLPVDTATGLERGLIDQIQPAWNMQGIVK